MRDMQHATQSLGGKPVSERGGGGDRIAPLSICCTATCTVKGLRENRVHTLATQLTSLRRQCRYHPAASEGRGLFRCIVLKSCGDGTSQGT